MNPELSSIVTLLQDNRPREAEQACNKYLSRRKNDADGWFVHAGIQSCLGNLGKVIESCRKVLKLQRITPPETGTALQSPQRHGEAIPYYEYAWPAT
jgi:hypothetical protein